VTGTVVVIGGPADVRGFALAGAVTIAGHAAAEIRRAVSGWLAPGANRPALVIVAPDAFALARDSLRALESVPDGPIVLVFPAGSDD
jgi:vacuolar-type H+-ATPase subunit F/Vma7